MMKREKHLGICIYCKKDKKLTLEHVIPNFLYNYQKSMGSYISWNERAKKALPSEHKIKDVCSDCNNEVLGGLDNHASIMLKETGILTENFTKKTIILNYNYQMLLRWILKVSFNSSRSTNSYHVHFNKYIPYINGDTLIDPDDAFLLIGLSKPDYIPDYEKQYFDKLSRDKNGLSHPFFVKLSLIIPINDDFIIRVINIGALVFHLLIFIKNVKLGVRRSKVKSWIKSKKGQQLVLSNKKIMLVKQLDETYLDNIDTIMDKMQVYGAI